MSNRERWIIYPLLFFAIMMGTVDIAQRGTAPSLSGPPRFSDLRCQQLILEDHDQQPIAVLNQNELGEVQLSLLHEDGAAVIMKASRGGGDLLLIRQADQESIYLGHDADLQFSGLTGVTIEHGRIIPLEDDAKAVEVIDWPKETSAAEQEESE